VVGMFETAKMIEVIEMFKTVEIVETVEPFNLHVMGSIFLVTKVVFLVMVIIRIHLFGSWLARHFVR